MSPTVARHTMKGGENCTGPKYRAISALLNCTVSIHQGGKPSPLYSELILALINVGKDAIVILHDCDQRYHSCKSTARPDQRTAQACP